MSTAQRAALCRIRPRSRPQNRIVRRWLRMCGRRRRMCRRCPAVLGGICGGMLLRCSKTAGIHGVRNETPILDRHRTR